MFIAMNRFSITPGREQEFIDIWKGRTSHLDGVPGFQHFAFVQGASLEDRTMFSTHTMWNSEEDFVNWTHSQNFQDSHKHAKSPEGLHVGPPVFEGWTQVA